MFNEKNKKNIGPGAENWLNFYFEHSAQDSYQGEGIRPS